MAFTIHHPLLVDSELSSVSPVPVHTNSKLAHTYYATLSCYNFLFCRHLRFIRSQQCTLRSSPCLLGENNSQQTLDWTVSVDKINDKMVFEVKLYTHGLIACPAANQNFPLPRKA